MKPMTCEKCGGTINPKTMTCEFCGTHYESEYGDMSVIHVATFRPKIHVGKSTFYIDHEAIELMGAKDATEYAVRELSKALAEQIAPMMTVRIKFDRSMNHHVVEGYVRMVEPDYRFGVD